MKRLYPLLFVSVLIINQTICQNIYEVVQHHRFKVRNNNNKTRDPKFIKPPKTVIVWELKNKHIVSKRIQNFYDNGILSKDTPMTLDGEINGTVIEYHNNGYYKTGDLNEIVESETNYVMGNKDGLFTLYHRNGKKKLSGNYKVFQRQGRWMKWYENGKKQFDKTYLEGKLTKVKRWNENGSLRTEPWDWDNDEGM